MLVLGSAGMFRELFLIPSRDLSLVVVGICMVLMLGPAVALVWLKGKASIEPESSSQSSVSHPS